MSGFGSGAKRPLVDTRIRRTECAECASIMARKCATLAMASVSDLRRQTREAPCDRYLPAMEPLANRYGAEPGFNG